MEPFVSTELTGKLRAQQMSLRSTFRNLEHQVAQTRNAQLGAQFRSAVRLFRAHEGLVNALLEAVEPDRPRSRPR